MRRWVLAGVGVFVVVGVTAAVYLLRYRTDDTTTPVGVGEAVDRYRGDATSTAAPTSELVPVPSTSAVTDVPPAAATTPGLLPVPGVYTYTTSGGDEVDALGGASHAYPATTTITVTASDCGVSQLWVAAEERSDEFVTCASGDGVRLARFSGFHRFFGSDEVETHECEGDPRPIGAAAGTKWTARCTRADELSTWTGVVIGTEVATAGGIDVAVEHVVVTIDNGDDRDSQRTETWYQQGTDLVVRRVVDNATTEGSPIGDVHYVEHYEISLDALTPVA